MNKNKNAMLKDKKPVRVALFGAAPDTPNMGVSALFKSVLTTLRYEVESIEFVVFDNGLGRRLSTVVDADGNEIRVVLFGARGGNRYYRQENLHTMLFLSNLGCFGALMNEGLRLIDSCDAVLDISGGDSFSDIYGLKRFNNINIPKVIAVNRGKPLILLPQTYGPYKAANVIKLASRSVLKASQTWARDEDSFKVLKSILGCEFNANKHKCGVDVAFLLQPVEAVDAIEPALNDWISGADLVSPLVGINVSGLIYNDLEGARINYGFKSDYKKILIDFISKLLETSDARIVLIPHVMDKGAHYESDSTACLDLVKHLPMQSKDRVLISPATLNESQVKWLISKMDWFCGTRMHSTIAGLSSGVPTAAISYSDKIKGVFDTCEQGDFVYDPRVLNEEAVVEGLMCSYNQYEGIKPVLAEEVRKVQSVAFSQMKSVSNYLLNSLNNTDSKNK